MKVAKMNFLEGMNFDNSVNFHGTTPGGRNIIVNVPGDVIVKLSEFLKYTGSMGHAVWHYLNHDELNDCLNCSSCEKLK